MGEERLLASRSRVVEGLLGGSEGSVGGGDAGVDGHLKQYLLDLAGAEAVAERGLHVHGQLLVVAHRGQDGQGDAGAGAPIQAGPAPDVAPGVAGDEILEVGREVGGGGGRLVDVGVAEHSSPDGHALVVAALVVHEVAPSQVAGSGTISVWVEASVRARSASGWPGGRPGPRPGRRPPTRPNSEKWMRAGRQALAWFCHGTEVGVQRRPMPVTVVAVAASRIDLPDLHQGATDRAAALLQDPP